MAGWCCGWVGMVLLTWARLGGAVGWHARGSAMAVTHGHGQLARDLTESLAAMQAVAGLNKNSLALLGPAAHLIDPTSQLLHSFTYSSCTQLFTAVFLISAGLNRARLPWMPASPAPVCRRMRQHTPALPAKQGHPVALLPLQPVMYVAFAGLPSVAHMACVHMCLPRRRCCSSGKWY